MPGFPWRDNGHKALCPLSTPHLARTVARARHTDSKICSDSSLPILSGPVLTCADHPNSTASYPLYCAPCRAPHENALVPGLVSLPLTPARTASTSTDRSRIDRHVRFNSGCAWASNLPCASKLDQAFPSAASRDFLGAWLVPKCAHFRGGSIWQVEIAALRGWTGSHDRRVPTARALLAGYNPNTSPSTHCSSCAPHRLENLL